MKTTLLISQHERCTRILEGIQSATMRRDSSAEYIKNGTLAMSYHSKQVAKYSAIRDRLIISYSAALENLVKPVIDKIKPELV